MAERQGYRLTQLRRAFDDAHRDRQDRRAPAASLESRPDAWVLRAGFAIHQARRMVAPGHVAVDGRKVYSR
ncbi:MAG TPA: S4 domain-containing protein [Asanoa sp.]